MHTLFKNQYNIRTNKIFNFLNHNKRKIGLVRIQKDARFNNNTIIQQINAGYEQYKYLETEIQKAFPTDSNISHSTITKRTTNHSYFANYYWKTKRLMNARKW